MGVVEEHARRVRGGYKAGCRYGMVVDVCGVVVGLVVENGLGGWDGRGLHVNIEREIEYLDDEGGVERLLLLCFGCRDSHTSSDFWFFALSTWAIPKFQYFYRPLMLSLSCLNDGFAKIAKIWSLLNPPARMLYGLLNKEHLSLRLCK